MAASIEKPPHESEGDDVGIVKDFVAEEAGWVWRTNEGSENPGHLDAHKELGGRSRFAADFGAADGER